MLSVVGTPYYIAPEVLGGNYGNKCDIWSTGVVLYQICSGEMPFDANNRTQLFNKIKRGKFDMPKKFSKDLQDLLRNMLEVNPKKRFSAKDCLEHKWIKDMLGSTYVQQDHGEIL